MALTDTGLYDWMQASAEKIALHGAEGIQDIFYDLYKVSWRLGWAIPRGTNIYDLEWDLLIVLDACRVDTLRSVMKDYAFIQSVDTIDSVGSMSKEWMAKTFRTSYADSISNTTLVTANVFSHHALSSEQFDTLDEVWRYAWDNDEATVHPRSVTDRIIAHGRANQSERMIAHYIQPHHPFVTSDNAFHGATFGPHTEDTVVDGLRKRKISRKSFMNAYRDNLRLVLDDIELLLSNIDAETVAITADHGEALGEWGIYGHPAGCLHSSVRTVPLVKTTANDTGSYTPNVTTDKSDKKVMKRLRSLGYY